MGDAAGQPWLTVVTVVKDDPEGFAITASSLRRQDTRGVEWVVIDSSGHALTLTATVQQDSAPSHRYQWVPPQGVYPAMNTGLAAASGTYIHFLNAGDRFHDDEILTRLRDVVQEGDPLWLYGQAAFIGTDGKATLPAPFDYARERAHGFSHGRFPPHQATVVRTEALRSLGGFDTTYRIAADYKVMLALAKLGDPREVADVIADFEVGGLSSTRWSASVAEFHRARREVLNLAGTNNLRERAATARQWASLGVYHALLAPGRPLSALRNRA
jgi:glycosyltransferase involved in cell wall biosynthesis